MRESEQEKVRFIVMPPGPQRDARDEYMRMQKELGRSNWEDCSESYLLKSWEEFCGIFGYDAFDDADTWWVEWGVLHERAKTKEKSDEDHFKGIFTVQTAHSITTSS